MVLVMNDAKTLTEWAEYLSCLWNTDRVDVVSQRIGGGRRYYYAHDHNGHTLNLERVRPISDLFTAGDGDAATNQILEDDAAWRDYIDDHASYADLAHGG